MADFSGLAPNMRSICEGLHPGLTDVQKASYAVWCTRYRDSVGNGSDSGGGVDGLYHLRHDRQSASARTHQPNPQPTPPGLGTAIESALSAVGITSERVSQFLGVECGCHQRAQKIDALTAWAKNWWNGVKIEPPFGNSQAPQ